MFTLAIHFGHDSNAALFDQKGLIGAVQEERLARRKNIGGWPRLSIEWLLSNSGANIEACKFVIVGKDALYESSGGNLTNLYARFHDRLTPKFLDALLISLDNLFQIGIRSYIIKRLIKKKLIELGSKDPCIEFVDHHEAHAYGAFFSSGFTEAMVLTLDGKGDRQSGSVYTFDFTHKGLSVEKIASVSDCSSIGLIYSVVTSILGFRANRHEGKITGLAARGGDSINAKFPLDHSSGELTSLFDCQNCSTWSIFVKFFCYSPTKFYKFLFSGNNPWQTLISYKVLDFVGNIKYKSKEDLSFWVQKNTERVVLEYLAHFNERNQTSNLCVAGGLFANVLLNQRIREAISPKKLFVMPNMGDGGLAYGAGVKVSKLNPGAAFLTSVYTGPEYSDEQIMETITSHGLELLKPLNVTSFAADLLASGKIIGIFKGRLEWGPRSLCNRSVIAYPSIGMGEILNSRLGRSDFMPFAPIILEEDANIILVGYNKSQDKVRHMTSTYSVSRRFDEFSSIIHVDGTIRPQVVTNEYDPVIWGILKRCKDKNGYGVLINTSYNLHEEPIVCSPEDAVTTAKRGAVDYILFNDKYLVKIN